MMADDVCAGGAASAQLPQCSSYVPPAGTQKNPWSCRRLGVTSASLDWIGPPTALLSHIKSQVILKEISVVFEKSTDTYVFSGQCTGVQIPPGFPRASHERQMGRGNLGMCLKVCPKSQRLRLAPCGHMAGGRRRHKRRLPAELRKQRQRYPAVARSEQWRAPAAESLQGVSDGRHTPASATNRPHSAGYQQRT